MERYHLGHPPSSSRKGRKAFCSPGLFPFTNICRRAARFVSLYERFVSLYEQGGETNQLPGMNWFRTGTNRFRTGTNRF